MKFYLNKHISCHLLLSSKPFFCPPKQTFINYSQKNVLLFTKIIFFTNNFAFLLSQFSKVFSSISGFLKLQKFQSHITKVMAKVKKVQCCSNLVVNARLSVCPSVCLSFCLSFFPSSPNFVLSVCMSFQSIFPASRKKVLCVLS